MFVDLPEAELRAYRSTQTDPADFDEFWAVTLAESRAHDVAVSLTPVDTGLTTLEVFDVSFSGFGGERIRGWLRYPAGATGPLPAVVEYVGYGGGRGAPIDNLLWASAGFVHLQMDTRGQGSAWSAGATPDSGGGGPQFPGFMTRGIESREGYYYRRLLTDAVRAVDAARSLDIVDPSRVAVYGRSQGGGMAIAVSGLVPDLAAMCTAVPFLCDYTRATTITDSAPYKEIGQYLATHRGARDDVLATLAYFDGVNFAKRAASPARFSVALMDATCPPSTVFGAFNNYGGDGDIIVWPYNGHEGGGPDDEAFFLSFLRDALA